MLIITETNRSQVKLIQLNILYRDIVIHCQSIVYMQFRGENNYNIPLRANIKTDPCTKIRVLMLKFITINLLKIFLVYYAHTETVNAILY